jgi:benzoylformate decarboxylase
VRDDRFIAMDLVNPTVDFAKLAASFGMTAHHVERAADIAPAIERASPRAP